MSSGFRQVEMDPVYGVCHYLSHTLYGIFFRGEVAGLEHIPARGSFLIAANHASFLDPPLIGAQVTRQLAFFARKTLWVGGIASWWLDEVGTIPVDRDGGQDVSAIKRVLVSLKSGKGLILFPEGTRTPDGHLQTPKAGMGLIACRAQVPVIPARIFGSFEAMGRSGAVKLGVPISIVFGKPLQPADYDTRQAGKERYQVASSRIFERIKQLSPPIIRVI